MKINADDPIMLKLEEVMEENDQFFTVADLGKIKFLYASEGIRKCLELSHANLIPAIL